MNVTDSDRKRRQGKMILVVEDDRPMARNIELILRYAGFGVNTVETGEEALSRLSVQQPTAILLDVELDPLGARWDGYETCSRMRDAHRDLQAPIIFVTGRKTQADILRAVQAGGDSFVSKPLSPETLLERVIHAMGRGKLQRRALA